MLGSVPNHFVEEEKHLELHNLIQNHSTEDKNARNSVPTNFQEGKNTKKLLVTGSEPFKDKKNTQMTFKKHSCWFEACF